MTLGERLYRAAASTGAAPFGDVGGWDGLADHVRERWEACARIVDAATRADVVGQIRAIAESGDAGDGHWGALTWVAGRVEAGRS